MPQDTYEVVRVTTPEGEEHTFFCGDDDVTFYLDIPAGGYLFIGAASDLVVTDEECDGLAVVYQPHAWSAVEQVFPPEDED